MSARVTRSVLALLLATTLTVSCGGEVSVSGWVRDVAPTADGVQFTLIVDSDPLTTLRLHIVGRLEGGGENFDANHLLDHAVKGLPVALSYATNADGRLIVVRATDAVWLAGRTPPPAP
ncbi:MAG: hypothetical protein WCP88_03880 [bacterium]